MDPNCQAILATRDSFIGRYCSSEHHSIPSPKTRTSTSHNPMKQQNICAKSVDLFSPGEVFDGDIKGAPSFQCNDYRGSCNAKSFHDVEQAMSFGYAMLYGRAIHSPCLQLDGLRYERDRIKTDLKQAGILEGNHNSYPSGCTVPLPDSLLFESGFIHRRNERERDRVRSLNDGYDKLKQSLPLKNKDKRISKVDTLRIAIRYIRQLRKMLKQTDISELRHVSDNCERISEDADSDAAKNAFSPTEIRSDETDEDDSYGGDDYEDASTSRILE